MSEFKSLIERGRFTALSSRRKYLDTMEKWALTSDAIISALMSLAVQDYYSGPEPDQIGQGEVWKFAPLVKTPAGLVQMYVKLKISQDLDRALCISFHDAEHRVMRFPYRNENRS